MMIHLLLTLCAAACRHEVPEDVDLVALSDRARPFLEDLAKNQATYATLPPEAQHAVLQQAMWISRKIRADKLRQVPPENLALAKLHREWIHRVLPEEFRTNKLYEIRDMLEGKTAPVHFSRIELKPTGGHYKVQYA